MKDKIIYILKKNGFLIVLFICVCIVAASTIIISTRELVVKEDVKEKKEKNEEILVAEGKNEQIDELGKDATQENNVEEIEDQDQEENQEVKARIEEDVDAEIVKEEAEESDLDIETVEVFKEKTEEIEFVDDSKEDKAEEKLLILPVEGEIINDYTNDTLIYSETLGEWRAHLGIDIKAEIGTNVKAVLDGKVKKTYNDGLWGNVIIIDHGNGIETKYTNLKTLEMVKEGNSVKKGDYISKVGKSADIEMIMDDHLHFEVYKNGKVVDPRSIIP